MLKLQYLDHLMQKADSMEKTLMVEKIEGKRKRGQQRMVRQHHRLKGHEFEQTLGNSGGLRLGMLQSMRSHRVRHDLMTEQQQQDAEEQKLK